MKVVLTSSALKALVKLSEGSIGGFSVGAFEELIQAGYIKLEPDNAGNPILTDAGEFVLCSLGVKRHPAEFLLSQATVLQA